MWAAFLLEGDIDGTLEIAQHVMGSEVVSEYNCPFSWASTNHAGLDIAERQVQSYGNLTMQEIKDTIGDGSHFGVFYRNETSGHWILGIGYVYVPGQGYRVVSIDPWGGVQSSRTYDDFQTLPDGRVWAWTV